jgi:hypothetical protein
VKPPLRNLQGFRRFVEERRPATITEKMVFYKMVEQCWLSALAATDFAEATERFCKDGDELPFSNQFKSPDGPAPAAGSSSSGSAASPK